MNESLFRGRDPEASNENIQVLQGNADLCGERLQRRNTLRDVAVHTVVGGDTALPERSAGGLPNTPSAEAEADQG